MPGLLSHCRLSGSWEQNRKNWCPLRDIAGHFLSCDCVWISQLNGQPEAGEEVCSTSKGSITIKPIAVVDRSTQFAPGASDTVHRGRFWTTASYSFALNSGKLSLSRENWCLTTSGHATATCVE